MLLKERELRCLKKVNNYNKQKNEKKLFAIYNE